VWLRVEVHRVRCRRCGVRTERLPFVEGKVHYTARLEAAVRDLFTLNRRLAKADLLKEQLAQLWTYTYEGAARRFLTNWLLALRWQRVPAFQRLGRMLTRHLDGILRLPREGPLREGRGHQRQHPCDAAPRPGLPGPRVPPPQGPEGNSFAPPPSDRMNTGPATDSGEERDYIRNYELYKECILYIGVQTGAGVGAVAGRAGRIRRW
jgi:hypothetical protein